MTNKRKKVTIERKFFDPDKILTQVASDYLWDLRRLRTEYGKRTGSTDFFTSAQLAASTKKYVKSCSEDESSSDITAYIKFLYVNEHMASFADGELLNQLPKSMKPSRDSFSQILRIAKNLCNNILSPLDTDEWYSLTKHSSGSSIGVPYRDTALEGKSTYPMSCGSRVKSLRDDYLLWDKQSRVALSIFNYQGDGDDKHQPDSTLNEESRSTTVPKTSKIDRMIAIEPTWNMFFQQGLMIAMYDRLAKYGLDVRFLPERHKQLAREASITGQSATIDFSSASDCVSPDLVKWILPPAWFSRLDMCRSPSVSLLGSEIPLNMFSTMGNAVTFPLETLIFYCLAVGTVHHIQTHETSLSTLCSFESKRSVSVFGDDCILPTYAASTFKQVCENVGFIVNEEKSFCDELGGFRESCGGDYLHGMDVRPLSFKAPTSTRLSAMEPWLYILMNGILKKYMLYFGSLTYMYDRRALKRFALLFQKYDLFLKVVPHSFPDDAGLKIGSDLERFKACYPGLKYSKISVSEHGAVEFRYCSFRYNAQARKSGDLRYADWLKGTSEMTIPLDQDVYSMWLERQRIARDFLLGYTVKPGLKPSETYRTKKDGGYVVAKAVTPFWGARAT